MISSTIEVAGRNGEYHQIGLGQLQQLQSKLAGHILTAGDDGWNDAIVVWNFMATKTPALVIQPESAEDVATAVDFAREQGLLLSIKGGGHHIAGTAIAERGLALNMSRMRSVQVDPIARTARVGPGCLLQDVDRATQQYGLATTLGFVSEVGVAGLTLGGGLGYLCRRFGWTVDNLLEVEIVTADGQIRRASRNEHADLFWAIRGAGANFGVVTEFTFQLHEVGPTVFGGMIAWPFDRANEVLAAYRRLTTEAPRELAAWLIFLEAPPAPFVPEEWHGKRCCVLAVCYSGYPDAAEAALAPIRELGDPVIDLLQPRPYVEVQSYLDFAEPKGENRYWRTHYVSALSDGLLTTVRDLAASCPMAEAEIGFLHIGGALNERAEDDGAVGNRDAQFALGINGRWGPDDPNGDAYRQWVREASTRVVPYTTGSSYINFQTADEDEARVRATYGRNFERLQQIKRKYDPGNLFRVNRNIRPA